MSSFGNCKIVLRNEKPIGIVVEFDLKGNLLLNHYFLDEDKKYQKETLQKFDDEYDILFDGGELRSEEEVIKFFYKEAQDMVKLMIDENFVDFYSSVKKWFTRVKERRKDK